MNSLLSNTAATGPSNYFLSPSKKSTSRPPAPQDKIWAFVDHGKKGWHSQPEAMLALVRWSTEARPSRSSCVCAAWHAGLLGSGYGSTAANSQQGGQGSHHPQEFLGGLRVVSMITLGWSLRTLWLRCSDVWRAGPGTLFRLGLEALSRNWLGSLPNSPLALVAWTSGSPSKVLLHKPRYGRQPIYIFGCGAAHLRSAGQTDLGCSPRQRTGHRSEGGLAHCGRCSGAPCWCPD